jgi:hypothetical protein
MLTGSKNPGRSIFNSKKIEIGILTSSVALAIISVCIPPVEWEE